MIQQLYEAEGEVTGVDYKGYNILRRFTSDRERGDIVEVSRKYPYNFEANEGNRCVAERTSEVAEMLNNNMRVTPQDAAYGTTLHPDNTRYYSRLIAFTLG